ncbi:hypothetical protein DUNSADRAFT_3291 [Dunaliella salina]|uniref:BHLH domain-containing protein n=1 Tax=Dunaliella salina TaxID=3046 RepID=A0ABQ7GU71_DUNSA|nr:hypothetical protein DUNSADRAFT_3291 [Dunaliella salina]KAF5838167.1 hypothetical protein DUNSADRAFT_3291 [Dunaliella salina]|eukprot:KAF5838165.1 hypothetical protein DUNSADRAFT_3291 [Dunaliella salina]
MRHCFSSSCLSPSSDELQQASTLTNISCTPSPSIVSSVELDIDETKVVTGEPSSHEPWLWTSSAAKQAAGAHDGLTYIEMLSHLHDAVPSKRQRDRCIRIKLMDSLRRVAQRVESKLGRRKHRTDTRCANLHDVPLCMM